MVCKHFEQPGELVMCLCGPYSEMLVYFGEGDLAEMHSVTSCAPFHVIALLCEYFVGNYVHGEMERPDLALVVLSLWCRVKHMPVV